MQRYLVAEEEVGIWVSRKAATRGPGDTFVWETTMQAKECSLKEKIVAQ